MTIQNLEPQGSETDDWRTREFFEPEIETASRQEIEQHQAERLVAVVAQAWEHSGFYRDLWSKAGVTPDDIRSLEDLTKLPTWSKRDVQDYRERTGDPFGGLTCVDPKSLVSISSTSGTTSEPELFPEIWDVAPPLPTAAVRDLWHLGLRPGDKALVPTGTFRNYFDRSFHMLGVTPVYADSWIGEGERMLQAIERHQISYLQLMLPSILEWEKLEDKYDIKQMLSSLKGAAFAGQPMGAALKSKVRDSWGVNLFTYTSAGDTGTAWEGIEHDGYQLWEDTMIPEVLDPVIDTVLHGDRQVGELVSTDIDNATAPYIRFRTGDLVRLTRTPAPSGRTHARMWLAGRAGDATVVAGTVIVQSELWQTIESLPELSDGMFQIINYAPLMDTLRLRVGYAPERTGDIEELKSRLAKSIREDLGVTADIALMPVEDILQYSSSVAKFPRVVKQ